jgi:hypothetical protein
MRVRLIFALLGFMFLTFLPFPRLSLAGAQANATQPAASPRFDGPAELPRLYVKSSLSDTPAPGRVRLLKPGDNLQDAIDSAKCGDTLALQAGGVFQGSFFFPQKSCDDAHWIIVRSSSNAELPPERTRITPCYAGIASLPGRPDLRCTSVRNVMARLELNSDNGSGPIQFSDGANHYRFIGLEITRAPNAPITALAFRKAPGTVHHIVFDRVWMHGTAQDETARGIALQGMTDVAVVDSYFSDFHCVAMTGSCTDAQTLSNGGGRQPGGPYKIVNNFLEASGENILFGGAPATMTPADIEIRRNHLFKPMIWKPGESGFVGGKSGRPFIVKNHFELKNAQRVLFEGNVLENVWGGFSQHGFSILLTPKNQGGQCPLCQVTDVTIRYIEINNVGGVLEIGNGRSDAGGSSQAGERYSIHDIEVQNVYSEHNRSSGVFAQIGSVMPPLSEVSIQHVTAFVPGKILSIFSPAERKIRNFTITNNILGTSGDQQIGTKGGGPRNCAFQPERAGPAGVVKNCFENPKFSRNLIIGWGSWPPDNILVKDFSAAGLRKVQVGPGNHYLLCKEKDNSGACKKPSPALGSATDGEDIGANVDAIVQATRGVR